MERFAPDYGKWYMVHKRFLRLAKNGKWERLAKVLSQNVELKNVVAMIDSSHIKVHMRATWAKGGNQDIGRTKVSLDLIKKIKLDALFGDRAYDTNSIINYAKKLSIKTVIPPKSKRKSKQNFDSALYHLRYIVKNTFLKFKRWRGIAIRYFKTFVAFRASFFVRAISLSLASP